MCTTACRGRSADDSPSVSGSQYWRVVADDFDDFCLDHHYCWLQYAVGATVAIG